MNKKLIAITIGDINGIGIKILIDTWKKNKIRNFILITDVKIIKRYFRNTNHNLKINIINLNNKKINYLQDALNIYSYKSKSNEDNTYKSLKIAYKLCIKKICIGMITLPLRKDLIKTKINKNFVGQTEFFQKLDKKEYSNMILYKENIIISPLTTHIELRKIPKIISDKKFLYNQIINLNSTLKIDMNIIKPKIVISGLNPHAGENGNIGKEEITTIIPVIKQLKGKKIDIHGPLSADSILINKNLKKYDCFIFLFHDQALIPFKYISKFTGVNYTGNLDIIRTSPDHGTAYDLINKKDISNISFINCYRFIKKIYRNRILNDKS